MPLYLKTRREHEFAKLKADRERLAHEALFRQYAADNLRILGAGLTFADVKYGTRNNTKVEVSRKPIYPAWSDLIKPKVKKVSKVKNITHKDRMDMFRGKGRLWSE